MKKKILSLSFGLILGVSVKSQSNWIGGGNLPAGGNLINAGNNIFGTIGAFPVRHFTGGGLKYTTTVGASLNNNIFSSANGNFSGDGIQIAAGAGSAPFATLDLFTTASNQTHIRMDGTALIQTASSRFEQYTNLNGFWFNATGNSQFGAPNSFTPQFIFNINSIEKGRLGSNGFWHIGNTATNALNTIEIESSAASPAGGVTGSGLRLTNMNSTNATVPNPGLGVLSVNNNGDVIYVPAVATANNGVINNAGAFQLGGACNSLAQIVASVLTTDRVVPIANFNFWFANGNNQTGGLGVGGQPASTGFCNTGNTFEISANLKNATYGNTNASGLRFTKLTSASSVVANGVNGVNNQKLLTVDQNGDVVLTNGANQFGGICGSNTNPLTSNWELPMNNFNFIFGGQSSTSDRVGIGTVCIPIAKLEVLNSTPWTTTISRAEKFQIYQLAL